MAVSFVSFMIPGRNLSEPHFTTRRVIAEGSDERYLTRIIQSVDIGRRPFCFAAGRLTIIVRIALTSYIWS
jgi:hypothetical protein